MFTLQQIQEAYAKVKTGAYFPNYIKEITKLGVKSYETFASDIHTVYNGDADHQLFSEPKFPITEIADESNTEEFQKDLKAHQQGKTDFISFRNSCIKWGVEKWVVDTQKMTCIYYNKKGSEVLAEKIPSV